MIEFWLQIVFKSNEHPWRNDRVEPYPRLGMNREQAIRWARGMSSGMGDCYQVTLFEDGKVIDYDA